MKKILLITTMLASISFSEGNAAFIKTDKGNDIYEHIHLLEKDFSKNTAFFNSYSNLFLNNETYSVDLEYKNQYLVNLILQNIRALNDFDINIKTKFLREHLDFSPETLNYFGIISTVSNQFLSYDAAWNSKSTRPNYLADEIFVFLNESNKFVNRLEEVIANMKVTYPDYPLNKYNQLIFNMTYEKENIDKKDFEEARKDIRKINENFYPELSLHKLRILWNIALMEIDYLGYIKDVKGLENLKNQFNHSDIDSKININKLNEKIDKIIEKIGR